VLLFNRFKPDNLMHVLHDDILPLYMTLKLISVVDGKNHIDIRNKPETKLVFFEGWEEGEFSQLYQLFSSNPIITKESLKSKGKVICFRDAYTGVSKSTVWYDYGFTKPQGPIENFQVTSREIHSLAQYMLGHLKQSDETLPISSGYLVLLTRKENRKIVNEVDLSLEIVGNLGIKVLNLNFEMFEFSKIVNLIHGSKGIIGMHGSLLSLAIFLKPGSVLVELFPYAINPSHYTPFKTLASIKGMGIVYKAWRNTKFENSVTHPDRPADEGGLGHLSDEEKKTIMEQTEVPPHLCCTDPSWLYHIYQDTVVDITEVISLVESSLEKSEKYFHQSDISFHPSQVKNVSCAMSKNISTWQLLVSWDTPWTVVLFDADNVQYEILVQDMVDKSKVKSYIADKSPFILDLSSESSYFVWTRCVLNTTLNGPYSDASQCVNP
ncbi:MAG: glycosyltransferase family 61 protein, partial [Candidatus Thiodiazotropha sp.]